MDGNPDGLTPHERRAHDTAWNGGDGGPGHFSTSTSSVNVVDLVLAALAGAIVFRAQGHPTPATAGFRTVLLAQLAAMLGTRLSLQGH
ncbi:hypothetical protein [Actinocrispum sp. NPDC049592]|uniref:hypothetical protein n=1 Tax=Actinocrispum sp. NPDC049592 TaxID=3154835 RepID=UPI003417B486